MRRVLSMLEMVVTGDTAEVVGKTKEVFSDFYGGRLRAKWMWPWHQPAGGTT